jgi:hypothetical protein
MKSLMGRERVPIAAKLDHENADFIDGLIKQFKPFEVSPSSAPLALKTHRNRKQGWLTRRSR